MAAAVDWPKIGRLGPPPPSTEGDADRPLAFQGELDRRRVDRQARSNVTTSEILHDRMPTAVFVLQSLSLAEHRKLCNKVGHRRPFAFPG
jgi:hypothetical protein